MSSEEVVTLKRSVNIKAVITEKLKEDMKVAIKKISKMGFPNQIQAPINGRPSLN